MKSLTELKRNIIYIRTESRTEAIERRYRQLDQLYQTFDQAYQEFHEHVSPQTYFQYSAALNRNIDMQAAPLKRHREVILFNRIPVPLPAKKERTNMVYR